MNREQIIQMAQEANIWIADGWEKHGTTVPELMRFAKVVAKHERNACIEAANNALTNEWEGVVDAVEAIRAKENNND